MPDSIVRAASRRASRRQPAKRSTKITCQKGALGLGRNLAHEVLDISQTGIRLVAREALEPGQGVVVTLQTFGHGRPRELAGVVVWCVPGADGRFCAGVRFEKPLPYGELLGLTYS